ncbi:helix-turn-helix domain-containing protein [Desulfoluna spongiiphila]|uniref:Zn-dependent peptidase ImmA, M78 family n=1 Tax=Desulfoluna spongiiphila TaxID=419481 RepID=A0A1G5G0E4_9BACT|nr:XRE family transcriptional regulator [Desulfoluna spongiiphila]SCY44976.1 Zn-dependent peptidase ImmA, M78 family [Desulfoluna spongiiphila]
MEKIKPMVEIELFNENRLTYARKYRALTIKALSEKIGVSSRTLSSIENGHKKDDTIRPTLEALQKCLNFPEAFFFQEDMPSLEKDTVSFRSLARMTATVRDKCLCAGQLALEFMGYVNFRIQLPKVDLPDLGNDTAEAAAAIIRNEWGIGEKPIRNMVHQMESKGIRVFSLYDRSTDIDAFSFWKDEEPYVFLNMNKSVERGRFDAAHELGHLVMHKHGGPKGKEAEMQANSFASALLMSEGTVKANTSSFMNLEDIIKAKRYWLVSAAALVRRMKDLSILTEWQYRTLNIDLSKHGCLKREPNPLEQRESSKLLPMIFKLLKDDGITKYHIAKGLRVSAKEIDALMFGLTMTGVEGGKPVEPNPPESFKQPPHLKIV